MIMMNQRKNMDELVNTGKLLGVSLDWTWNRTDLVQKKDYTRWIIHTLYCGG